MSGVAQKTDLIRPRVLERREPGDKDVRPGYLAPHRGRDVRQRVRAGADEEPPVSGLFIRHDTLLDGPRLPASGPFVVSDTRREPTARWSRGEALDMERE